MRPDSKRHRTSYEDKYSHKRRRKDTNEKVLPLNRDVPSNGWLSEGMSKKDWFQPPDSDNFGSSIDYIGFVPLSDVEEMQVKAIDWDREWDKGKRVPSDATSRSLKRKARTDDRDLDRDDRYASKQQIIDVTRKAPWADDVDWDKYTNVAEMLHAEVEAFARYISPTSIEHELRSMIVQIIKRSVEDAFPDATVCTFGSFETRLYLPLGDIDLVVQSDYMSRRDRVAILKSLATVIRRAGIAEHVTVIAKAKVPIIKFVTIHGLIPVDISVNQTNGIAAGRMINRFLGKMPALRSVILVIKSFLNQRNMNEVFSGGLGSYSIVCMAISFLQMHPKIRRGEIDPSKNLGTLVVEFFELYGCYFNYEKTGISLQNGGSYFSKVRRGWVDPRKIDLLSIEDPGDSSNDISKGSFTIHNVRRTFAGAYQILRAAAYLRAGNLNARRNEQYVNLRGQGAFILPEDMSILSTVMGVNQETINHRRVVREVYEKGTMQRSLGALPAKEMSYSERTSFISGSLQSFDKEVEETEKKNSILSNPLRNGGEYVKEGEIPKGRVLGSSQVSHTIFTSDEDEDDDELIVNSIEETSLNDTVNYRRRDFRPAVDRMDASDRRRAYWASKNSALTSFQKGENR